MSSIGMNLAGVRYYSGEEPFIDRFKTAGNWTSYFSNGTQAASAVDANGDPIWQTGVTAMQVQVGLDPLAASPIDTYVLTYSGTATIQVVGATILNSQPGQITFQFTATSTNSVPLKITSTDPTDPIHDFHVVRSDQVGLYQSGETFNPDFIAKVSDWSVLRFMDWGNTNANMAPVSWTNRPEVTDATWSQNGGGVPIEVMVKLANEAHTDMWINIPTVADDSYVKGALTYIRDHLDPTLKVNVEYSNEVWNWGFSQTTYAQNQANALWGVDANGDGKIDPNDPNEAVASGQLVYYGYRSAQIAAIGNSVFGSDPRLQVVVAQQPGSTNAYKYIFDGASRANVGTVASLFDELAVTTYFGNALMGTKAADQATVLQWANSGAAGITAAFNELANGGTLTTDTSLKWLAASLSDVYDIAQNYGLDLVAYEGGAHLTSSNFAAADQATITNFFGLLMNDPRMGDLYKSMADIFNAQGGSTLIAYNDVGTNSKFGYWGVLDDIYDAGSPRYDALLQAVNDGKTAIIDTGDIVTRFTTFQLANAGVTLTYSGTQAFTGTGNDLDNVITGGSSADRLYGGLGNDTLYGGNGNDLLDGGLGADMMVGGAGNDLYYVDDAGDVVVEALSAGTDEVRVSLAQYALTPNVENLTFVGTGNFKAIGNALNNVITGGAGDDVIDGGAGADRMVGGLGGDTYYVDNASDSVVEAANAGTDTVYTTLSTYTVPTNVEIVRFTGTGNFNGYGNSANNVIYAGAGDDRIDGGAGADTMVGGKGNDLYLVDNSGDKIVENANEGYDKVTASADYALSANVEDLMLIGSALKGTGSAVNNVITGNGLNNTLDGGAGNDTLLGGSGDDVLIGGAGADVMTGGIGADHFVFASVSDIATGTAHDVITDFTHAQFDLIDLSGIDASGQITGNQGFNYIGTAAFTLHAGELRAYYDAPTDQMIIQGDTNGDGVADFNIYASHIRTLAASDFLL